LFGEVSFHILSGRKGRKRRRVREREEEEEMEEVTTREVDKWEKKENSKRPNGHPAKGRANEQVEWNAPKHL
jgi:hypothetical protein